MRVSFLTGVNIVQKNYNCSEAEPNCSAGLSENFVIVNAQFTFFLHSELEENNNFLLYSNVNAFNTGINILQKEQAYFWGIFWMLWGRISDFQWEIP